MSWLDHLKDAVMESDPDPTPTPPAVPVSVPDNHPYVPTSGTAPIPMDGFLNKLRAKLQNPVSVVDKFEATLSSLTAIPEMGTRITAAANVLKNTAGIEISQVQSAYSARLDLVENQIQQFTQALAAQKVSEVDNRESQMAQITSSIESKNKEIQGLSTQRESLSAEIVSAKTKLAAAQAGFDGAVATVRTEVQEAINRLKGIQ